MQDVVNKLLITKSLLTMPTNVLPLCLKQTFPPIIWIFTEGDEMESRLPFKIFSTLTFHENIFCETYFASDFTYLVGIKAANDAEMTIFTLMKRLLIILTFWFIFFVSVHNVSLHFCIMDSWWPSNACWSHFFYHCIFWNGKKYPFARVKNDIRSGKLFAIWGGKFNRNQFINV